MKNLRGILLVSTLVVGGCATSDVVESEYDEVARILGAGMSVADRAGELGALTDSTLLARDQMPFGFDSAFGLVSGTHGDFDHRYFVTCIDKSGYAIDPCGPSTERALVFAAWTGPIQTPTHRGTVRGGGYWTVNTPWRETVMITGDTWFEFEAGTYRIEDYRDVMLVVDPAYQAITAGAMNAAITLTKGADEPIGIDGEITLTWRQATITLDGFHTTTVDLQPLVIR